MYDGRVFAYFKVKDISDLKELNRRLKRIKTIVLVYHRIEEVRSWLKRIKSAFKVWKKQSDT